MASQFYEDMLKFKADRIGMARTGGPAYGDQPLIWFDQIFEWGLTPAGEVDCCQPLRVGATQNSLDVVLRASNANEGPVEIPAGSTITLTLSQAERVDGDFEEVGPTICVKAPDGGMSCQPNELCARFALGNFTKPWLKVKLEFSGAISGGTMDCGLAYAPR